MKVSLSASKYKNRQPKEEFLRELLQHMKTVPGVQAAGFEVGAITMIGPGNPYQNQIGAAKFTAASAGYLQATGMNLLKGRWMTDEDANDVVLVNGTFARSMFRGRDPVGRSIHVFRRTTDSTIVGVVSDLKRFALDRDTMPEVYMPYRQFPVSSIR
jgi:putative ABC transport system permease protein